MTLPAFATLEQFGARLPEAIADADSARAQAALDDASTLIRIEAEQDWSDGTEVDFGDLAARYQDAIVTVCIAAARRAFLNPEGVKVESFQDFSTEYETSNGNVYLTSAERSLIRSASGGRQGLFTVATTREDPVGISDLGTLDPRNGTFYADVEDGGPMPWLTEGEVGR